MMTEDRAGISEWTEEPSDRIFDEKRMERFIRERLTGLRYAEALGALQFAKEKHAGQYRKPGRSGEKIPYIHHPLLLACHALALGFVEEDLLSVCLLHDVCEDCHVELSELPVGETARRAVSLLTKPEGFRKTPEEEEAYYGGIGEDRIAAIVKILDRVNNVSDMAACFSDRQMAAYIRETEEYVKPLIRSARTRWPEYSDRLFLIRYHLYSVMDALKHHMRNQSEPGGHL